jgi:hypothetical protein
MASGLETIGSKESDFYAEYWHKEELLRVLIRNSEGRVIDERRRLSFEGWLELKSCENPRKTYLNHYQPKRIDYDAMREAGIRISPAARLGTPPEIEEARRRDERNKPLGCGMILFLVWLGATGLVLLASLVGNLLKR